VVTPKSRPTALEALKHGWLNGAACKHQQLQAAPHRLQQLINGRKLKVCEHITADSTSCYKKWHQNTNCCNKIL